MSILKMKLYRRFIQRHLETIVSKDILDAYEIENPIDAEIILLQEVKHFTAKKWLRGRYEN